MMTFEPAKAFAFSLETCPPSFPCCYLRSDCVRISTVEAVVCDITQQMQQSHAALYYGNVELASFVTTTETAAQVHVAEQVLGSRCTKKARW